MVGGREEISDTSRGVEVEGNVEVTLATDGGGGGGLVGAGPNDRGGTGNGVSRTRVTTSGKLVAGGCLSAGLVLASELRPMEKLGDPVVVLITFVGVDSP